mgnify:CR=1 FL=1
MTPICNLEDDLNIFAVRRIHDKEKPHQCKKCGKIFAWRKAQKNEYSIEKTILMQEMWEAISLEKGTKIIFNCAKPN